jgi:histidinol phosphatase-like PHP family hydrolase
VPLSNGSLAELLARAAEAEEGHRARALRRASRHALQWTVEASDVVEADRSLTDLSAVGPWVARQIAGWLHDPPEVPEPPPTRRGFVTMAWAHAVLDADPSWRAAVRGDLQMHTTWSDGKAELDEMVAAAEALGRSYVAVTDHSKGLPIARGMSEATLARQRTAIDALNRQLEEAGRRIRALRSIEMNLSPEGAGDMDPDTLGRLDLVLGAFHSRLRVGEDQTDRYLAAIRNPTVDILAHPRGRRFGTRPGLNADWPRVFQEAAAVGTALEVDAFPDRQDLEVPLVRLAAEAGATISIGTDAHRPGELRFLDLGLATVAAAGVPPEQVLNVRSAEEVRAWSRLSREGRR